VPVDGRIFKPGRVEMEHLVEVGKPERWGDEPGSGSPRGVPGPGSGAGAGPSHKGKERGKGSASLDQWG
jgi:hypothetical protein